MSDLMKRLTPRVVSRAMTVALATGAIMCVAPSGAHALYEPHFGYPMWTTIDNASLFQCPWAVIGGPSCNQGVVLHGAYSGRPDDVSYLCSDYRAGVKSPWGQPWQLALNRTNWQVGYIDRQFLYDHLQRFYWPWDCASVGHGVHTTINHASLFQCPHAVIGAPAFSCNQGEVVNGTPSGHPDDVAAICQLSSDSPWGHHWWLVLDHANLGVGFIDSGFLVPQAGPFTPESC